MTPLVLFGVFVSLTESVVGVALWKSQGGVQVALTFFVCAFPFAILAAFFSVLWARPFHFYPPPEDADADGAAKYVSAVARANSAHANADSPTGTIAVSPLPLPVTQTGDVAHGDTKKGGPSGNEDGDFEMKMFVAYSDKNGELGDKLFTAALDAEKNVVKKDDLRLWRAFLRFSNMGAEDALSEILDFCKASEHQTRLSALFWASLCYQRIKDFSSAISYSKAALDYSLTSEKPAKIRELAGVYALDGQITTAVQLLCDAIKTFPEPDAQGAFYSELESIYDLNGDQELRGLAAEKAAEYLPLDTRLKFAAGYAFAHAGLSHLSIFHYEALIAFKSDHGAALNNVGVEYQRMNMAIFAAKRYRQGFAKNESLAGSNLAYMLINAGLEKEAEEILAKAKAMIEPHENVSSAVVSLSNKLKEEEEKRKNILNIGRIEQRFFRGYAEGRLLGDEPIKFCGRWTAETGDSFELKLLDSEIVADWQQDGIGFKLRGKVTNRTAKIEVVGSSDSPRTLISALSIPTPQKGYAYVTADRTEMHWLLMEGNKVTLRRFRPSIVLAALPSVAQPMLAGGT